MSNQFPIMNLSDGYSYGRNLLKQIGNEMPSGKPIMCPEDAGLLAQIIYNTRGNDHIEIGSAHGGSALVVLKTMEWLGRGDKVVCVDPFGIKSPEKPLKQSFLKNIDHFGYTNRVELIKAYSHPFPKMLRNRMFATAFIDGNHHYEYVLNDWNNLKDRVDCYIMFHDYGKVDVRQVISEHVSKDPLWTMAALHGWSAVYVNTKLLRMDLHWYQQPGSDVEDYSRDE